MQNICRVNQVLYRWIRLEQAGINVNKLVTEKGYKKIALYGFTDLARCLIYEMKDICPIVFIVDRQGGNLQIDIPGYTIDDFPEDVADVIINCYLDNGEIESELRKKCNCSVMSIEELLYEL